MRPNLTITDARELDHDVLIERCDAILAAYDKPEVEVTPEKLDRLSRTIEEVPSVYGWFLSLHEHCDHWTDWAAKQFGLSSLEYKRWRQRRDLFEDKAKVAKLRYEAASRSLTTMLEFQPDGMPRSRSGVG